MNKHLSILLTLSMLLSSLTFVWAEDPKYSTLVEYRNESAVETYMITVPAHLSPGDTGTVTATGTWPSSKTLTVTSDSSVNLESSLDGETKTLGITFKGLELPGNNVSEITGSEDITVGEMSGILFGNWSGHFNYSASLGEVITYTPIELNYENLYLTGYDPDAEMIDEYTIPYRFLGTDGVYYQTEPLYWTFGMINNIRHIIVPGEFKSVGEGTFRMSGVEEVTLLEGIEEIENSGISGATSLSRVNLPNTLKTIGEYGLGMNPELREITIPISVNTIGNDAFVEFDPDVVGSGKIETIYYEGTWEQWEAIDFAERNATLHNATIICLQDNEATYTLFANNLSDIGYTGEVGEDLVVPESFVKNGITYNITQLDESVFEGAKNLNSVILPNTITSLQERTFMACSSLTYIKLPDTLTDLGRSSFYNCIKLESIVIPEGVEELGYHQFFGCSSMTSITLPSTLKSIHNYAFQNCSALTEVHYAGTMDEWSAISGVTTAEVIKYAMIHCTDGSLVQ